jgi:hypothetical protein
VAVQGNETGRNGGDRHAVNKCKHESEGTRIAAIVPATGLMAGALHCLNFKHHPPRQSGCGLAQLYKDLSTPLGTGFGGKPAIRFRHAEEANPKNAKPNNTGTRNFVEFTDVHAIQKNWR